MVGMCPLRILTQKSVFVFFFPKVGDIWGSNTWGPSSGLTHVHLTTTTTYSILLVKITNEISCCLIYFILCMHAFPACICTIACLEAEVNRSQQWIPWHWNYKWLWAALGVLVLEPRFSERAARVLKNWASSPAPGNYYFCGYLLPQLWFSTIRLLG